MHPATARIAYGKGRIPLPLDPALADWSVIAPTEGPRLADPRAAFFEAAARPVGAPPLASLARPGDRVCIVTSDGTRAVPNRQLIPWIVEAMGVADAQVEVLLGTGTHRPNTPAEIDAMFGEETARRLRIVNHDAYDAGRNVRVGESPMGVAAFVDRAWVEADVRVVVGFIEPHFFAGFSGGPKGVVPGVAGIDSILHLHCYDLIAHPNSTWGVIEGNPIQSEIRGMVALCPPHFMVNVTLDAEKAISGAYLGHYLEAHAVGCEAVRASAMVAVREPFDLVVTSNSGFPLDQNLYQTVKGISAAARIAKPGGTILVASECADGLPSHGAFGSLMSGAANPADVLAGIRGLARPTLDQWQAQILCDILGRNEIVLHSALGPEDLAKSKLTAAPDLAAAARERLRRIGAGARAAVMPEGPLTIPYLAA